MIETHPFKPFVPKHTKYLLLGSFTGKMTPSNNYDWFYGTKRNQFWKIFEGVYSLSLPDKESKIKLFSNLSLAITDVIYQCERKKGSNLDNNLVNIVYNTYAISNILKNYRIRKIFLSSRFVEKIFRKIFKTFVTQNCEIELVTLPSPSPRYAKLSLHDKIEIYKRFLPKL